MIYPLGSIWIVYINFVESSAVPEALVFLGQLS